MLFEARQRPLTDKELTLAIAARVEQYIHAGFEQPKTPAEKLLKVAVYVGEGVYLSPEKAHHIVEEALERQTAEEKRYWNAVVPEEGIPVFGPHWVEVFNYPGRQRSVRIYADPPEALVTRLINQDRVIK